MEKFVQTMEFIPRVPQMLKKAIAANQQEHSTCTRLKTMRKKTEERTQGFISGLQVGGCACIQMD